MTKRSIHLEDGKFTVEVHPDAPGYGMLHVLRNGEPWPAYYSPGPRTRRMVGGTRDDYAKVNNLERALIQRVAELEDEVAELEAKEATDRQARFNHSVRYGTNGFLTTTAEYLRLAMGCSKDSTTKRGEVRYGKVRDLQFD